MTIIHRMYCHDKVQYHSYFFLYKKKQRQVSSLLDVQLRVYAFNTVTHPTSNLPHRTQLNISYITTNCLYYFNN